MLQLCSFWNNQHEDLGPVVVEWPSPIDFLVAGFHAQVEQTVYHRSNENHHGQLLNLEILPPVHRQPLQNNAQYDQSNNQICHHKKR